MDHFLFSLATLFKETPSRIDNKEANSIASLSLMLDPVPILTDNLYEFNVTFTNSTKFNPNVKNKQLGDRVADEDNGVGKEWVCSTTSLFFVSN